VIGRAVCTAQRAMLVRASFGTRFALLLRLLHAAAVVESACARQKSSPLCICLKFSAPLGFSAHAQTAATEHQQVYGDSARSAQVEKRRRTRRGKYQRQNARRRRISRDASAAQRLLAVASRARALTVKTWLGIIWIYLLKTYGWTRLFETVISRRPRAQQRSTGSNGETRARAAQRIAHAARIAWRSGGAPLSRQTWRRQSKGVRAAAAAYANIFGGDERGIVTPYGGLSHVRAAAYNHGGVASVHAAGRGTAKCFAARRRMCGIRRMNWCSLASAAALLRAVNGKNNFRLWRLWTTCQLAAKARGRHNASMFIGRRRGAGAPGHSFMTNGDESQKHQQDNVTRQHATACGARRGIAANVRHRA